VWRKENIWKLGETRINRWLIAKYVKTGCINPSTHESVYKSTIIDDVTSGNIDHDRAAGQHFNPALIQKAGKGRPTRSANAQDVAVRQKFLCRRMVEAGAFEFWRKPGAIVIMAFHSKACGSGGDFPPDAAHA
jgi:hypothetical protein